MTVTTANGPLTVRAILGQDRAGEDLTEVIGRRLHEQGAARTALAGVRHLSDAAFRTVDHEAAAVVTGLLDLDLGDVLVSCWRSHRALVEAAHHTLAAPGSEEVVVLADHRATAAYSPTVDLLVDGLKVATLEFRLTLVLDVVAVEAVVRDGRLVGLYGGDCSVAASLTLDGAPLAQRTHRFDPALVVNLHPGIRLLDRDRPRAQ